MKKMKNLRTRILNPFRWVVGVMTLAFITLWIAQTLIANKTLNQQMEQKFGAIGTNFRMMIEDLSKNINLLSDNYPELWNAITESDYATIDEELSWIVKSAKFSGYLFVDESGEVVASTFEEYNTEEITEIINTILHWKT